MQSCTLCFDIIEQSCFVQELLSSIVPSEVFTTQTQLTDSDMKNQTKRVESNGTRRLDPVV